ncbi:G-protein coupled receptor Mth2-like [Phlebotomus argentipes]|uniref:G-protein coupled receptor Mth2-like n=1 Tax=Phlebotomus argentipes TaxID=94469 RepID=UPI002892E09D|nr:G-protein coupled receptor Mth2-like [Phlebotomus argentipes]XP_059613891.1 G-protein coupled receptor Mth2-like [Phlebotomus argentipes]
MGKEGATFVALLTLGASLQWSLVASQALVRDSLGVPCDFFDSINITGGVEDTEGNIVFRGVVYPPDQYGEFDYEMVNWTTKFSVEPHLRGCICRMGDKKCVRFCCPEDKVYGNDGCERPKLSVNANSPVLIDVLEEDGNVTLAVNVEERFAIVYGKPCVQMFDLDPEQYPDTDTYVLVYDGHLRVGEDPPQNKNEYCIARRLSRNESNVETAVFSCFPETEQAKFFIYPIGMLLSVPFLVVTFLVYAIIPELRNLHGKSLMCYVFGLTMSYTFLSMIHLRVYMNGFWCTFIGFFVYFFFLVSFFWLNVMCIDIWWTFRGVRGVQRDADRKKFIIYSVYAWGCSIVILSIAVAMQFAESVPESMKPGFGVNSCWLKSEKLTEFCFLYLPVIILISINVILFTLTSIQIRKLQQETAAMNKGDSRRFNRMEADRDRFSLYLRLFIVMGVTWTTEVISWIVDPKSWIFYITDVCNCLQGFFIFMLFVWKPKIKQLIIKRYRSVRGLPVSSKASRSSTRTSTSHVSMAATSSINRSSVKANNNSVTEKSHFMSDIGD